MLTNPPFLNVKALVGTFNQEKALVEAFSVIVKSSFPALAVKCLVPGLAWHTCSAEDQR